MCFYLFSPQKEIRIEFLSEAIYLTPFGSSRIFCDILIKNLDDNPLYDLLMIIPNNFFKITSEGKNLFFKYGDFQDMTEQLKNASDPINLTYKLSGYELVRDGLNTINIIKPNPNNIKEPKIYTGEIIDNGQNTFCFFDKFMDITNIFINYLNFSIFKYSFGNPIETNKSRWIRLYFAPNKTAVYYPSRFRMIVLWLLDNLKFNYKILGPFDVLNNFIEKVSIQEWQIGQDIKKEKHIDIKNALNQQLVAISEVKEKIIEPSSKSKAIFNNLSIHVFPGRLRMLQSVYTFGSIHPIGTIPNYLEDNEISLRSSASWRRRVYDWKSGNITDIGNDKFGIFFTGHSSNRLLNGFILFVAIWVFVAQFILPIINIILLKFKLINASIEVNKIRKLVFFEYPEVSLAVGLFLGLFLSVVIDDIKMLLRKWRKNNRRYRL